MRLLTSRDPDAITRSCSAMFSALTPAGPLSDLRLPVNASPGRARCVARLPRRPRLDINHPLLLLQFEFMNNESFHQNLAPKNWRNNQLQNSNIF